MKLNNPEIRRFISGSLFAGAFIWVAVTQFEVDTDIVWTFFLMSFVFVGGMMGIGLILTPVFRLMNRRPPIAPSSVESDFAEKAAEKEREPVDEKPQ